MEAKNEKRICLERPAREDLISKLPDALISQILSYLPTKDIVRTSVLSKRWKRVWLLIPGLDLDSYEFPDYNTFVSFVNKFLDFSREQKSCLHKLKLDIHKDHENDQSCATPWIDFVARGNLTHLDVEFGGYALWREFWEMMPVSLYICETLLHLRLYRVLMGNFESVSLPRLKTLCLERNIYPNEASVESLISSCPVLEDLTIVRMNDNVKVLRVYSQSLTSFSVGYNPGDLIRKYNYYSEKVRENSGLVIDAPRLKYLTFNYERSKSKIVRNLSSLVKVNVLSAFDISSVVGCSEQQMAHNFFTGISRVREMIISQNMMERIFSYLSVDSLPQFCNLSYLKGNVCSTSVTFLDVFTKLLESCPNLKSIVLVLTCFTDYTDEMVEMRVWSVPKCLLSSLEFVEIKNEYEADDGVLEVARYFVENSINLKKLVLHLQYSFLKQGNPAILKDLIALPRRSSMCQIEVFNVHNGRALGIF
ncbi:putative F-box/FBD/LRR-repeat protein At5g22610 [Arabidopsis lyrata subsp. lyrata]|uniref:putative F-box/FBD/LRR-repeat protein At5g22610 n=1 Tax=Arabidopsis lyrata subsp. lyrata TaxID=81972 RepID=UPI000A29D25A|nr:putative F-box/FBD/LRR-repeat protein At5g22610 [Arabidopsis lyrata subsp. lyrata]|eukprot:XP_020876307.1 putative F-box/FBD/LRR-repeat protein At5g22610 [Arabidopsis lyrata subsp. lyrata]